MAPFWFGIIFSFYHARTRPRLFLALSLASTDRNGIAPQPQWRPTRIAKYRPHREDPVDQRLSEYLRTELGGGSCGDTMECPGTQKGIWEMVVL